jgi:hypothetical protein
VFFSLRTPMRDNVVLLLSLMASCALAYDPSRAVLPSYMPLTNEIRDSLDRHGRKSL